MRTAAQHTGIGPGLFRFLRDLKANNRREWFLENKDRYEVEVRRPMLRFISDLAPRLARISRQFVADPRPVGGSLFRIHRDTRFSKDKTPYKTSVAAHFHHRASGKDVHAPGFYLHIEPGRCLAGAGIWQPEAEALKRIRDAIVARPAEWRAAAPRSGPLEGHSLKRPPGGYDPQHPLIEDVKRKDFITTISLTEAQVCSPRFLADYVRACEAMSPLVRFLTRALGLVW